MNRTRQEVEQDLLEECRAKGFRPGSLFVPKSDFFLPRVPGKLNGVSVPAENLADYKQQSDYVFQEDIWMLVGVHAVDNHGYWDFWFEFLNKEETFYVKMYHVISRMKEYFEVRTND